MKYPLSLMILIFLSAASVVQAQSPQNTPDEAKLKVINGGVLNGKAIILSKPSYPAAARAINVEGTVVVQVTIDEEGTVVAAKAVSGNPLLRQAAIEAAQTSKFSPTRLEGQPVKVTGVIAYNFILPVSFTLIGYELSTAEKTLSLDKSKLISIAESFPKNWEERADLMKLDLYLAEKNVQERKTERAKLPSETAAEQPKSQNGDYVEKVNSNVNRVITVGIASAGPVMVNTVYKLDDNSVEIIREVQTKIENRIKVNDKILWSFKLGGILGKLKNDVENSQQTLADVAELQQLTSIIPLGIADSVITKTAAIVELFKQNTIDAERKEKLTALIEDLRNLRGF